jgi:hypothetical protein
MIHPDIQSIVKGHITVFRSFKNAASYASHCIKTHWIVLGYNDGESDGEYWVVTPADASRLNRAGFEIA